MIIFMTRTIIFTHTEILVAGIHMRAALVPVLGMVKTVNGADPVNQWTGPARSRYEPLFGPS